MDNIIGFFLLVTGAIASPELDSISISPTYEIVSPGENIWFTLMLNCTDSIKTKMELDYWIEDASGNILSTKRESVLICGDSELLAYLKAPERPGEYYIVSGNTRTLFQVAADKTIHQSVIDESLFDIILEIPDSYRIISPNSQMLATIKLINIGSAGRIDVFLEYSMLDPEGETIFNKRETVAVETQANFIRTFDIPADARTGLYKMRARMVYADGKYADSELSFNVIKSKWKDLIILAVSGIIVSIILIEGFFRFRPEFRRILLRKKIAGIVRRKPGLRAQRQ